MVCLLRWVFTLPCSPLFLCAASDHLPEVPDHHADPDPRSSAVCCASVPYSWGITHSMMYMLHYNRVNIILGVSLAGPFHKYFWPLHRETCWVFSMCSTPRRPVCTSWPPFWTAGGLTRCVHCILIGNTTAQLGQRWSKVATQDCKIKPNVELGTQHSRENFKM